MTEYLVDHDRLVIDRLSIEYVANAFETSSTLSGVHRDADTDGDEIRGCREITG